MSWPICRSASASNRYTFEMGDQQSGPLAHVRSSNGVFVSSAVAALLVAAAWSSTSAQQARRPAPNEVVATVGSSEITLAEVDDKALEQPAPAGVKLSQALFDARQAALDDIIANRLLDAAAKSQGVDRAALVEKEITAKISPVSDAEIAAWYQANQNRVQGAPLEQVRQPIKNYLTQERMQTI